MTASATRRCRTGLFAVPLVALIACAAGPTALPPGYAEPHVRFFVAHAPGDDSNMEQAIAAELRRRGLQADAGDYERRPPETDVVVLYRDRWWLNILAQGEILVLEIRDARTGATIAAAEQRWLSYVGDSPDTLVADAVGQVIGR
jgi:hypothetical protein